jgi:hypothetical protein
MLFLIITILIQIAFTQNQVAIKVNNSYVDMYNNGVYYE